MPPLKRMRTIVMKSILVDHFIKDVKREIVFKDIVNSEEAKDHLHDLPSSEDIGKKSMRLASPPPDSDLPSEFRKMSYRELNKQCLSSYSSTGSQTSGSEVAVPTVRLFPFFMKIQEHFNHSKLCLYYTFKVLIVYCICIEGA